MPIPAMSIRRPLIVSALIILAMAALSLAAAAVLPATMPLRFNAHGVATAYGSPLAPLAIMPLAAVVLSATFASPRCAAPRRSNRLYPRRLVFVLVGTMIAIAGGQLGRLRSNFMIGIRTPWTLADDQVWNRTHRLARWPAMLAGLAIVLAALAAPEAILLKLTLAILLAVGGGLVLLSYLLWRRRDARLRS